MSNDDVSRGRPSERRPVEPVLPRRGAADSAASWGDRESTEEDDLRRLTEDRPPHWDAD